VNEYQEDSLRIVTSPTTDGYFVLKVRFFNILSLRLQFAEVWYGPESTSGPSKATAVELDSEPGASV
jgi:hypothetical protein